MTPNTLLELGRLYCERGDLKQAEPKLVESSNLFFALRDFDNFLEAQNLLLRIFAEREQYDKIQETKEKLQDLVLKEGFELSARTFYSLGLAAHYRNQAELALDYGQKSLSLALQSDNKKDICYAIFLIANTSAGRVAGGARQRQSRYTYLHAPPSPETLPRLRYRCRLPPPR